MPKALYSKTKTKMMKKIISIIFISILIFVFISCDNTDSTTNNNSRRIKEHLIERVDSMKYKQIDTISFDKIIDINFDKLFIFTPYTPTSEIDKSLGFNWKDSEKTLIRHDEISNLLVFTKGNEVIAYFDHPRDKGDFIKIGSKSFSRLEATFQLKEEEIWGGQKKLFFYLITSK